MTPPNGREHRDKKTLAKKVKHFEYRTGQDRTGNRTRQDWTGLDRGQDGTVRTSTKRKSTTTLPAGTWAPFTHTNSRAQTRKRERDKPGQNNQAGGRGQGGDGEVVCVHAINTE